VRAESAERNVTTASRLRDEEWRRQRWAGAAGNLLVLAWYEGALGVDDMGRVPIFGMSGAHTVDNPDGETFLALALIKRHKFSCNSASEPTVAILIAIATTWLPRVRRPWCPRQRGSYALPTIGRLSK